MKENGEMSGGIDQLAWLEKMRDYISANGSVDRGHLEPTTSSARSTARSVNDSGR